MRLLIPLSATILKPFRHFVWAVHFQKDVLALTTSQPPCDDTNNSAALTLPLGCPSSLSKVSHCQRTNFHCDRSHCFSSSPTASFSHSGQLSRVGCAREMLVSAVSAGSWSAALGEWASKGDMSIWGEVGCTSDAEGAWSAELSAKSFASALRGEPEEMLCISEG